MSDNSCCSCVFARYEVNKTDVGNYIVCSIGFEITDKMTVDEHCNEYVKREIK